MGALERVPDEGDSVESDRYLFRVLKMDGPRIVMIEATPKTSPLSTLLSEAKGNDETQPKGKD
jgi:CBS domain containing-hemolysin-like protein